MHSYSKTGQVRCALEYIEIGGPIWVAFTGQVLLERVRSCSTVALSYWTSMVMRRTFIGGGKEHLSVVVSDICPRPYVTFAHDPRRHLSIAIGDICHYSQVTFVHKGKHLLLYPYYSV